MREGSWKECLECDSAFRITPNKAKARSLMETAKSRADFLGSISGGKGGENFIFEGYYSSLIEVLHAVLILRGYKVTNHICIGFYIRDVMGDRAIFEKFDDMRSKRNSIIYYGRTMEPQIAGESIDKAKRLIGELLKMASGML